MTPSNLTPKTPWLVEPSLPHFTETFSPWRPKRSFFWRSFGMSFHGVSRLTLHALAAALAMLKIHPSPRAIADCHGTMAPPRMVSVLSTTTRAGSISARVPSPLHDGHMPSGELKENDCGESSG